ncbi:MAG: hypothetical protein KF864_15345 [Phycisphaeraceae bacterium]|nr:hypothetical protein [Phycisphaeraceae bacterium]
MPARPGFAFVHGCIWRGHSCPHGRRKTSTNAEYWTAKVARNRDRDRRTLAALRCAGRRVLVVWECQTRDRVRPAQRLSGFLAASRPYAATFTVVNSDHVASSPRGCSPNWPWRQRFAALASLELGVETRLGGHGQERERGRVGHFRRVPRILHEQHQPGEVSTYDPRRESTRCGRRGAGDPHHVPRVLQLEGCAGQCV